MKKASPKSDDRLWVETILGGVAVIVGVAGVGLMIWREAYNPFALTICTLLAGGGGIYVNKLRGESVLKGLAEAVKLWRGREN